MQREGWCGCGREDGDASQRTELVSLVLVELLFDGFAVELMAGGRWVVCGVGSVGWRHTGGRYQREAGWSVPDGRDTAAQFEGNGSAKIMKGQGTAVAGRTICSQSIRLEQRWRRCKPAREH